MVTEKAAALHNNMTDLLYVHRDYLSGAGHSFSRAAAEYEVRGTEESLAGLHQKLQRYIAVYEQLREELVKWEADLDAFCDGFGDLEVKPAEIDDLDDVFDWVEKASRLYKPLWRP
jgi:hypothetical protein